MHSAWTGIYQVDDVSHPENARSANPADATERLVPVTQLPIGPWTSHLEGPSTSGCDSSNCTYCQGMASRRRVGPSACWLRRKRSENELAVLAQQQSSTAADPSTNRNSLSSDGTAVVPNVDTTTTDIKYDSMWDQALMEPHEALEAVNLRLTQTVGNCTCPGNCGQPKSIYSPWAWDPKYLRRPDPIPSSLLEIAHFSAPRASGQFQLPGTLAATADIVCGMEFEEHGWLLATAGVSKQVRVYSLASFLANPQDNNLSTVATQHPLRVHRLASKLSSLAWNPDQPGVATIGDYDGVVVQLDLESGHVVAEQDEHYGRRVWSVTHSHLRPHLAASASEDGTATLWTGAGLAQMAAELRPSCGGKAAVTGVQLSPFDENALAVSCADTNAYIYDLRQMNTPLLTMHGHARPVSYVKFLDRTTLVTAATDATLAAWKLPSGNSDAYSTTAQGSAMVLEKPERVFRGHTNGKNFVGLAVRPEDQLVACGSESSQVFSYSMAWNSPVASYDFCSAKTAECASVFCTAVAWQPAGAAPDCGPVLAAATSDGDVRVLDLRRTEE